MYLVGNFFSSSEWDNSFVGEFRTAARRAVASANLPNIEQTENFATGFADAVYSIVKEAYARDARYAFGIDFNENSIYKAGGRAYALSAVRVRLFAPLLRKYLTRNIISAGAFLQEYNANMAGTLKTESETSATGTSESASTGTNAQKFNNGVNTSSTGTANKTETSDSSTGITTGATTGRTATQYAREYDGNAAEFIASSLGADAVSVCAAAFKNAFIRAADLYPWEIADNSKIL